MYLVTVSNCFPHFAVVMNILPGLTRSVFHVAFRNLYKSSDNLNYTLWNCEELRPGIYLYKQNKNSWRKKVLYAHQKKPFPENLGSLHSLMEERKWEHQMRTRSVSPILFCLHISPALIPHNALKCHLGYPYFYMRYEMQIRHRKHGKYW
jgi:hypothetical protein